MDRQRRVTVEVAGTIVGTHLLYTFLVDPALESVDPSLALSDTEPPLYTPFGRFGTLPVGGTDFSQPAIYIYLATIFTVFGLYVALRRDTLSRLGEQYPVTTNWRTDAAGTGRTDERSGPVTYLPTRGEDGKRVG